MVWGMEQYEDPKYLLSVIAQQNEVLRRVIAERDELRQHQKPQLRFHLRRRLPPLTPLHRHQSPFVQAIEPDVRGSRTRLHAFTHDTLRPSAAKRTSLQYPSGGTRDRFR